MLQSLERQSGLPIAFDPTTNTIRWPSGIRVEQTSVRTAREMKEYTADPAATASQDTIYTVYRNLARSEDAAAIDTSGLRYDITVIPPGFFTGRSREFFRTAGHYHVPATSIEYPEVYEVLSGHAYWLIQRPRPGAPSDLEEIYAIEAVAGEKALMPPGFGHITVNAYSEPLVTANWIGKSTRYDYQPYRELRGGGYWLLESSSPETIEFENNANYHTVPELKKLRPRELPAFGLTRSRPLYTLATDPQHLRFLISPDEFRAALAVEQCYRVLS